MKRLSFFLVLALIAAPAFAQLAVDADISAEAEVRFGVDLDSTVDAGITTGFETSASFDIELVLREEASEEVGEGDVYGWIQVEDITITLAESSDDSGPTDPIDITWGGINAELRFGPIVYVDIRAGEFEVDKASDLTLIGGNLVAHASAVSYNHDNDSASIGLGFNLLDGDLNLEFGFASQIQSGTPTLDGVPIVDDYYLSFVASYSGLSFMDISFITTLAENWATTIVGETINAYEALALGLKLEHDFAVGLDGDLRFQPDLGLDLVVSPDGEETQIDMELAAGLNLTWAARGTDEDDQSLGFLVDDQEVTSGLGIGVNYTQTDLTRDGGEQALAVKVGLYEDDGDSGIVPLMGAAAIFDLNVDLTNDNAMDYGLGLYTTFDIGIVDPYAGIIYRSISEETDFQVKVGATISEVVANTTFGIDWESGNLLAEATEKNSNLFVGDVGMSSTSQLGRIYLSATISF